jgi:hypothetical protein
VTVLLSGPAGEPYWLELDPERAAVLREDLAGPDGAVTVDRAAVLREAADWFERECPDAGGSMDLCMCHAAEPLRQWVDEAQQPEANFTEARAAFMQIGRTPSLEGLRAELRIEGWPPLVGRYIGASMGRMRDVPGHEHLLSVDPRLIFEYADEQPAAVPAQQPEAAEGAQR